MGSRYEDDNENDMPCRDCGHIGPHICIPCSSQAEIDEYVEVCGTVDVPSGRPVIYYIHAEGARMLEESVGELMDAICLRLSREE